MPLVLSVVAEQTYIYMDTSKKVQTSFRTVILKVQTPVLDK